MGNDYNGNYVNPIASQFRLKLCTTFIANESTTFSQTIHIYSFKVFIRDSTDLINLRFII